MPLSETRRAVLAAVCEAIVPPIERSDDPAGFFALSAADVDTATKVETLISKIEDPDALSRLLLLLDALGNPVVNLTLSGKPAPFHHMSLSDRQAVLRGWAHSRLELRRVGFQALKRLTQIAFYGSPASNGTHPAWQAVGYPGPLAQPAVEVPPLPIHKVEKDTTLECDVVVVGAGAGGGVVAGLLAEAGKSVVVLDKGGNPGSRDMTQREAEMLNALYLDAGLLMNHSGSLPILAGSALGGGTVINYMTSFPLPDTIRAEWSERSGLGLFTSARFDESLRRVSTRLNVGTRWSTPSRRDQLLEKGLTALGWHVGLIPRNATDCPEGLECGYCGYGCRHGAKNSTARTYLRDAAARGARLIPHCTVDRVLCERGRATGVVGSVRAANGDSHALTVRARVVIVAAGAVYTPALLVRSGLTNPNIGRNLHLHPATATLGFFPERVEPWSGVMQARYSDQFADLDGRGYGARFETTAIHFALPASAFGWTSPQQMKEDIADLGHLSLVGVLLRDRDAGRVAVGRDGRPRVHYELSPHDVGHVRQALRGAAQVLAAAGATRVMTLQTPPARASTGNGRWLDEFTASADCRGYTRGRMSYITFHQMASCAMGKDPRRSVVGESGETHETRGLYVADGSAFVTSSGVNPMITIQAIADHIARGLIERW